MNQDVQRPRGGQIAPEQLAMLWKSAARRKPVETLVTNVRNLESPFWRTALARPLQRSLVPVTAPAITAPDRTFT
jgi:hypothetical protein